MGEDLAEEGNFTEGLEGREAEELVEKEWKAIRWEGVTEQSAAMSISSFAWGASLVLSWKNLGVFVSQIKIPSEPNLMK